MKIMQLCNVLLVPRTQRLRGPDYETPATDAGRFTNAAHPEFSAQVWTWWKLFEDRS
jgi:hypothetical protein